MSAHTPKILGFGHYAPSRTLTNADLEKMVDTSDDWITTRTGIKERHVAAPDEACSDLALPAARQALEQAGLTPDSLTHIFVATFTPDAYVPSAACVLQHKLGASQAMAMDLAAACSGFLYSLETARAFLAIHPEAKILVVGSEVITSRTNFTDRSTCVLFGDAAGAAVLGNQDNAIAALDDVLLGADGSLGDLLVVRGGGSGAPVALGESVDESFFVQMQGSEVFRHAVRSMASITNQVLARAGLSAKDIDLFIPHQANIRIIEALAKKLAFPIDKVYVNVNRFGNSSAASVPLALSEALQEGYIPEDATVLLASFGGGFTWGAALLKFGRGH
ncbi:beta-ketoacyl-ACP synthase III [Desulfohalobium retbaense]|uniref:Beta-ketoacyl-[acyl-carrier-protein] synthase III n=1 Tax=Desulfohalobium retbaense (strain ATCC 49708 / DSM 5692 / JCM 16813 / HR100) TaxID=485915 RepID=C8X2Q4_DESRD|nr:beta-ketoacyl-ACP synthase III [Desulfohalobium retbaense]ACV68701.1 3-oxoacyl-(acyl-carrier-protein) synthase III [Desulfohalobium retbaense DSM 5692]